MKKFAFLIGLLVVAVALAACGGGGSSSGGGGEAKTITIKGSDDFKFNPAEITVNKGDTVKLVLQNTGAAVHDLEIKEFKVHIIAEPGKSAEAEFTASKAGEFEMVCIQPGHKEAGMKGKLIVKG